MVRVFQKAIRSNERIRAKTIPECTARDMRIHSVSFPAREIKQMTIIRTSAVKRSLLALNSLKVNFSDLTEPRTKEYLCDTIFSSPVAQKLFPDNSIVLNWIPMEASQSNIDHFQHELGQDFYFAVEKFGEDSIHRSVSFGALTPRVG